MTETNIREEIGAQIKELRYARNLTQQELADLAKITRPNLCNIEAGKYSVGIEILHRISEALNASIKIIPKNSIMKTVYISNSILSDENIANAIEEQHINLICNQDMNIEISEEDYEKLCKIIDPSDIMDV